MRRALPTLSLVLALPLASASVSLAFDVVSVERSLHVDSTESLSAGWSPPPDPPFPLPTPDCVTASGTTALSDGYADAAAHPIDETVAVDPAALCTDWIVPPSSVLRATRPPASAHP